MKDLIFVTYVYFQILLVQCDIFDNNLNGSDTSIKMCIQKTINHLFSHNDTLSLILNSDLCEDAIFEMNTTRPYIVLNMEAINDVNKLQYDGQFIICPKDVRSLNRTIYNADDIAQRNMRRLGNSKILVITNSTDADASSMFEMFWSYGINNVIILVHEEGTSKLFTCNRFAPENACAKTAKLMIHQDCEEQLSLSFTSVIHQMNKGPVIFWIVPNSILYQDTRYPYTRAILYIIVELTNHLNGTFQRIMINNLREYYYLTRMRGIIPISLGFDDSLGRYDVTKPLLRKNIVWLVPKAREISNMNVCLKVFTYDVWIATIIVFICVALIWFLIISRNGGFTFDKLCISFLNVWSLTIFGNVAQLPRPTSLALRILLSFYLFYAINMQFAFTSDMSTILTTPQYEFQIRTLKELADSQLPIYSFHGFKEYYMKVNMTDRKLYTKLQNLIHGLSDTQYFNYPLALHLHRNYVVAMVRDDMLGLEIAYNTKVEAYKITDSSIIPATEIRLRLTHIDHYFTTTLNTFVDRMIETGIYEKRKNDFFDEIFAESVEKTPEDDAITLKHLIFIFVFFGFGLCTACVVFCFELVLNKYL